MQLIVSIICAGVGLLVSSSVSASNGRYPRMSSLNNYLPSELYPEDNEYRGRQHPIYSAPDAASGSNYIRIFEDDNTNFGSSSQISASASAAGYAAFPVQKQVPNYSRPAPPVHDIYNNIPIEQFLTHRTFDQEEQKLPYKFDVTENCMTYDFGPFDDSLTPADKMRQLSSLTFTLSIISSFFDSFDLESFADYLKRSPSTLKNPYLRYQIVKDLILRASKIANSDAIGRITEFINVVDNLLYPSMTDNYEKTAFEEFKKFIANKRIILSSTPLRSFSGFIDTFTSNEESRLYPLSKFISESKYDEAKQILSTSDRKLVMTNSDFELLLKNKCRLERSNFMLFVLRSGYFNPFAIDEGSDKNCLIKAVKYCSKSFDVIAALLITTGSELKTLGTKPGKDALYYAKRNDDLSSESKIKTIKLLSMERVTEEDLEQLFKKKW